MRESDADSPKETSLSGFEHPSAINELHALWYFGEWEKVLDVADEMLANHAADSNVLLLKGAAHFHLGNTAEARELLNSALEEGCDKKLAKRVLISGLHNTMARIELLRGNTQRGDIHLAESIRVLGSSSVSSSALRSRKFREYLSMDLLPNAAELLQEAHTEISDPLTRPSHQRNLAAILESEIELLNHQLSLAQQKGQLFNDQIAVTAKLEVDSLRQLSLSQLGQDLWVAEQTNFKRNGYFVEFGATDGVRLSNTFMLEKHFDWTGICAEPNPKFFAQLQRNRSCIVSDACIDDVSGKRVKFILAGEYGQIEGSGSKDKQSSKREAYAAEGNTIDLQTISLNDFLTKYAAPRQIDYLSVDTEGNEFAILNNLDFERWDIKLLTVEHNFTAEREDIFELLSSKGYKRVQHKWDDWYFKD